MRRRAVASLPHAIVCGTFLAYGTPAALGVVLTAAFAIAIATGPRARPGRFGQLVWHALALVLGFLAARQVDPDTGVADALACAALTTLAMRKLVVAPARAPAVDITLLLGAQTAIGEAHRGWPYGVASAMLVAAIVGQSEPGAVTRLRARAGVLAVILAVAAVVTGLLLVGLPWLNRLTNRQITSYVVAHARTGFEGRVHLGPSSPIYESNDIVMHVDGARADYLRGRVFDVLSGSTWYGTHTSDAPPDRVVTGGAATTVHLVWPGRQRFAPLGATVAGTRVDGYGVMSGDVVGEYAVVPAEVVAITTDADLRVPEHLRPRLEAVAREWTLGATTDTEKLERIHRRLRTDYRYTLARRPAAGNELLDFVFISREGHCEYFASALALLARTVGVRTRVATGYRVVERNAYGDYWIVREKHAHAWVEAYVQGRWETWDATPEATTLEPRDSHAPSALWDFLRRRSGAAWEVIAATGWRGLLGLVAFLAAVRGAVWLRRRRAGGAPGGPAKGPAHPLYPLLARALARAGVERPEAETLEELAERIEGEAADVAVVVRRYAAFRYGGLGDEAALRRELEALVAGPRRERPR